MQEELLARYPAASVRVYTVWFSMLPQDRRSAWDADLMPDGRVTHLWDDDRAVGRWFADHVQQTGRIVRDTYLLYGPDAAWDDVPQPLIGTGRTVIAARRQLADEMTPLLQP